jgi:hypothetical protein
MRMNSVFSNKASFMKRFLLSVLLILGTGQMAFGYINGGIVQVPQMDPQLVSIDDPNFVNKGTFSVDMTLIQNLTSATLLYTTSDTLNYTNTGRLIGIPGFDFENFPASVGQAQMAANFVNVNKGFGGGEIDVTNIYGNSTLFGFFGGFFGTFFNFDLPGLAMVKVRATNVVDSGLINIDNTGLVDISGGDVDLSRGRILMNNGSTIVTANSTFGISYLDYGGGVYGSNSFGWFPAGDLTPTTALSPFFTTIDFFDAQMLLTNATPYFENSNPQPGPDGVIVWRGVYLQDSSPTNVTKTVYFGPSASGFTFGSFNIEWAGAYRDPTTGLFTTNYFYLSDEPTLRRSTNTFTPPFPSDFTFFQSPTKLVFANPPAVAGYVNPAPFTTVTNDFSYASVRLTAVLVDTNTVIGGSPTNLPGRIQLSANHTLNLANTRITGPNYLSLSSPYHFLGNSNAVIEAPYSDINLGVTNGSLTLSNLLVPQLPSWSGVPGAPSAVTGLGLTLFNFVPVEMGGLQVWSGSYFFLDANGVTNDVQMLLVNSALQPTTPALQQNVTLHAPDNLVVSDELNIYRHFFSDTTTLTLTTNSNSAFSLAGQLNLLSPDIFWSASLPNLQYLTNWGRISTKNLANFAGNMFSASSDPAGATPYQAFVNHGTIENQGTFIRANYFENSGVIEEDLANNIDIGVSTAAIATNGLFLAPLGSVSLAANSLFLSNGVINAGQSLTLTAPCSLSDGYVFGNQFGHITNSVLPNVVTNGNIWTAGGGVQITVKPPTADLLGTTISNFAVNSIDSINVWPGKDMGAVPDGFADNLALGRMVLNADANPSQFTFRSVNGSSALYVDSIELQGNTTNTDANGNPQSIAIEPGMRIYYAQAIQNGVSIAEKLNGKFGAAYTNGGQFFWVSNYAGVYSSTNIAYPDGNSYIFNQALVISPDIDSDGDGTVNRDDETPIPIGTVFDITITGPLPCDGGNGQGYGNGTNGTGPTSGPVKPPGSLAFPVPSSGSANLRFRLAAGSYNGLFYDTNGVNPVSSGSFRANVTARGGLTAKLVLGGYTYSFSKPPFDSSGHFSGTVSTRGVAGSLNVDLQLVNNDHIVGQVSGDGWIAQLLAYRAAFSSRNKAPWAGNDTLLLATVDTNSTAQAGDSFGTVKISSAGTVQWSGMLPDGTKVSQKSTLSKNGIWPLYYPANDGAGCLIGWMQCTNDSDITGSGVWVVPAAPGGLYPQGLTNEMNATGSRASGSLGAHASVTAVISGAPLASAVTNSVIISGKNSQSADGRLKISANLKTGLFTGSVTDPNSSQTLSFQGALLEQSGIGGGFFLNTDKSQGGKVHLTPAN